MLNTKKLCKDCQNAIAPQNPEHWTQWQCAADRVCERIELVTGTVQAAFFRPCVYARQENFKCGPHALLFKAKASEGLAA
jgi:hypothetical protein